MRKVFVVYGENQILMATGPVGVGATREIAERILKNNEFQLDRSRIAEMDLEEE